MASPRINSTLLANFIGQSVTLVGRKTGTNGHMMHIEGPDGGDIVIDRSVSNRPWGTAFVEVVGVVNSDRTVRESRSTDFGNDFGMLYQLISYLFHVTWVRLGSELICRFLQISKCTTRWFCYQMVR
jgi:hypothetical protein